MTEVQNGHRSTPSSSFIPIPIMAPRPAQSSLPSSLSLPQLALQHPPRQSPNYSASPIFSADSVPNTPSLGKSTFRSLRNFLPFGPGKPQSPNTSMTPKGRTLSLGKLSISERRPLPVPEQKVTEPVRQNSLEFTPIMVIESPFGSKDKNFLSSKSSLDLKSFRISPLASPLVLNSDNDLPHLSSSSREPLGDLSTIIESETSVVSMSKHIPVLDDSVDVKDAKQKRIANLSGQELPTSDSANSSAFDLSTSKLADEVRDAMSDKDQKRDWLHGIVFEDQPVSNGLVHDVSFNLSALDPELASLLSPHRLTASEPAGTLIRKHSAPEATPLAQGSSEFSTRPSASSSTSETWSSARPSRDPTSHQPSPLPSRNSFTASTSSRSPSSMPRPARPWRTSKDITRPDSSLSSPREPRLSLSGVRNPTPSPSAVDEHGFLARSTDDSYGRRSASSRLDTPTRASALYHPPITRPPLRHLASSSGHWDTESISPSSRASSSMGTAASRRPYPPRPSFDSEGRPSLEHGRVGLFRTRTRSMSDGKASPGATSTPYRSSSTTVRPSVVPGPRTTRLLRAAGLIPAGEDRADSRFSFTRVSNDRDFRQTAPSRSGYSELSRSSSSWGRQRAGTISESASVRVGTPFSASTAPTTISLSSVQHHDSEIQIMKDKHQMEMDALLSALHDSQSMNKSLKEENAGLRSRIQDLEDRNMELLDKFRRPSPALLTAHRYPSSDRISRTDVESVYKRNRPPRSQTLYPTDNLENRNSNHSSSPSLRDRDRDRERERERESAILDPNSFLDGSLGKKSSRNLKRTSVSSSVFQAPPSTMSMLNDENDEVVLPQDSMACASDSPPPSPTLVFGKVHQLQVQEPLAHMRTHTMSMTSSYGNVSPTTANFSSVLDSPSSLRLRSDHEDHLGDMASLDLRAEFLEEF